MLTRLILALSLSILALGTITPHASAMDVCDDVLVPHNVDCPSTDRICVRLFGLPIPRICFPVI